MAVPIKVAGTIKNGELCEADLHRCGNDRGLVVFTVPLHEDFQRSAFAVNADLGFQMAVDAGFGGTPEVVHVGISDGVNWTGSNIVGGKGNFDSGDRANSGTVSVKWDNMALNDIIEFDQGSDLTASDHVAVTMAVNIDKDWSAGDSISLYAYDTGLASTIGTEVFIEDYLNEFSFDVWQNVVIPFVDLGLASTDFDAFRMSHPSKGGGKSPKFYIDDFQVEQQGVPAVFSIESPSGEVFSVEKFTLTFIDNTPFADGLSYDKILGLTRLANGVQIFRTQSNIINFASLFTSIGDLTIGGGEKSDHYGDATNTVASFDIVFSEPISLDPRSNDSLSIVVSDDLSGLISFTALARGKSREI